MGFIAGVQRRRHDRNFAYVMIDRLQDAEERLTHGHVSLAEARDIQALTIDVFGTDCWQAAQGRAVLARVLLDGDAAAEAEQEARAAAALRGTLNSDRFPHIAWATMAMALDHQGRHAQAAEELDALARILAAKEADRLQRAQVRSGRAAVLYHLGCYPQAEAESRTVFDDPAVAQISGMGRVRLAAAGHLSRAFAAQGRFAEGEAVARSTIEGLSRLPQTARGRFLLTLNLALADCLNGRGRYDEALHASTHAKHELLLSGLATQGTVAAADTATAASLLATGQFGQALDFAHAAVQASATALSPVHHNTLELGTLIGRALAGQGSTAEAAGLLRTNTAAWLQHFGPDHPKYLAAARALAETERAPSPDTP